MVRIKVNAHIVKRWHEGRKFDAERKNFIIGKRYEIVKIWDCLWWKQVRDDKTMKERLKIDFPFRKPLSEQQLLQQIDNGSLFGYVQCDISSKLLRTFSSIFQELFCQQSQ